jgi:hypothetical protein
MKKILAILLVGIFVVSIPAASSLMIPRIAMKEVINTPIQSTEVPEWADGNITGAYAIKNETGEFEIIGNIFGHYHLSWGNYTGYYRGVWETLDGSQSGEFAGWFIYYLSVGYYNVTGSEETGGFVSLFRRNETDMTIQAIAFGSQGDDDYFTRYALCSYTIFE